MEESGDRDEDNRADVERYETLRRHAMGGEASGWRLGLAVMQRQGVTAWLRAWQTIPPAPAPRSSVRSPVGDDELVAVLATMALACVAGK
ncbi:MAG: hypothetical protein NVSMB4_04730 [Acidimicrobiales bacterium]